MNFKRLGNSGLKVSSLCMGTMTFGDGADEKECRKLYRACRDKGVNFFDCANVYANGKSETILGELIKGHRKDVVITSKVFYPTGKNAHDRGLSRRHITDALHNSLARLDTDYIDLYYLHNFDYETPLHETLSALDDFVRQGKILYVGVSNFAAWQVMKAVGLATKHGFDPAVCIQPMYNLLKRQCESELLPMAQSEGLGAVSYSPIAGGMLSGKYLGGRSKQGRFDSSEMYARRYADHEYIQTVEKFAEVANDLGIHPVTLAVAWVRSHAAITAPIIGARDMEQLRTSLAALKFDMTPELRSTISELSLAPSSAHDRSEEDN